MAKVLHAPLGALVVCLGATMCVLPEVTLPADAPVVPAEAPDGLGSDSAPPSSGVASEAMPSRTSTADGGPAESGNAARAAGGDGGDSPAIAGAGVGGMSGDAAGPSGPCSCSADDGCCESCHGRSDGDVCGPEAECSEGRCSAGSCTLKVKQGYCFIANTCYRAGQQAPRYDCQYCDPEKSQDKFSLRPAGTPCDDGQFCNGTDACGEHGQCSESTGSPCITSLCEGCAEVSQTCRPSTTHYYDESRKLLWSSPSADVSWQQAIEMCEEDRRCDSDGWQAPTVDMLRTVVQGCTTTQAGGGCRLSELCLSSACADSCQGCPNNVGLSNGHFLPRQIAAGSGRIWTRSSLSDQPGLAWVFDSITGAFSAQSKADATAAMICVRAD